MRTIPDEMSAALARGVTTFAHVWRVTRRDGALFGFTDHDRTLTFDALVCTPAQSVRLGAVEKSLGLGVDTATVTGALNDDAVTEADIAAGLWDGARIDVFKVDWSDTTQRVHLFAGRFGEVRRGAQAFETELRGLQAPLNVPVGRVFSRFCDADLGDARCGFDLETSAFRGDGAVAEVIGAAAFRATGLEAYADGWFTRGRVVWADGAQSEVATHRVEATGVVIEMLDARAALGVGDTFSIYAGCDKRLETCRAKFDNVANFRGFPHMPGNDALQATPQSGDQLDGDSRFS